MTDDPVKLDLHRGMSAQKATELRRLEAAVAANEASLRRSRDELESQLLGRPAGTWPEAAAKARYLLTLFASTLEAKDPRRQQLIANALADFRRLEEGCTS